MYFQMSSECVDFASSQKGLARKDSTESTLNQYGKLVIKLVQAFLLGTDFETTFSYMVCLYLGC